MKPKILIALFLLISVARAQPTEPDPQLLTVPTMQTLFFQCKNEMRVYPLERGFRPELVSMELEGGEVIIDPDEPQSAILVPQIRTFDLQALPCKDGTSLPVDQVEFNVIKPPKPTIKLYHNDTIEVKPGGAIPRNSTLTLRILPDPVFAKTHPEDAKYRIKSVQLGSFFHCAGGNIRTYHPKVSQDCVSIVLPQEFWRGGGSYYPQDQGHLPGEFSGQADQRGVQRSGIVHKTSVEIITKATRDRAASAIHLRKPGLIEARSSSLLSVFH